MLREIHQGITDYLASLDLGEGPAPAVLFRTPGPGWLPDGHGPAISAWCTGIEDADARSRGPRPELRLAARFLVTAWHPAPDPEDSTLASAALFGRLWTALALAPMKRSPDSNPFVEPLQEAVPDGLWHSIGLPPRPALWLRGVAVRERPIPQARPVEYRVFRGLDDRPGATTLSGKVTCGADRKPLAGALVLLPESGRQTRTDALGNFVFLDVQADPLPLVAVEHGGAREETRAAAQAGGLAPVLLHLQT